MNRALNVLILGIALIPLQVNALSVTIRTDTSVQTDLVPSNLEREWIIDSPTSETSTNLQVIDQAAYARQFSAAAANAGSVAVVTISDTSGVFDSTGGVGPSEAVWATGLAEAKVVIDDIIFTGPGFSTTTSINVDVSGLFSNSVNPGGADIFARSSTSVAVAVDFSASGNDFDGSRFETVEQLGTNASVTIDQTDVGDLAGFTFPGTISLGNFTVSLNQPYTLELYLFVQSSARLLGDGTGSANNLVDFGSTMNLPTSGPVFDLAAGYSVNSVSADIVDNAWLGTPVSVSPIPLPPAAILLIAPLAVLMKRQLYRKLAWLV